MIKIRETIQKGKAHLVFCQDATYTFETEEIVVAGVFDGCSEVKDSHFASTLFTKILRKISHDYGMNDEIHNEILKAKGLPEISKFSQLMIRMFFLELKNVQQLLYLNSDDLAATSIFLFYSKVQNKGVIYAFGDGYLNINGEEIIIDHNNIPQYAYRNWTQLTGTDFDFEDYMKYFDQRYEFDNLKNIVISTDGILTFKNTKNPDISKQDAIDFLVKDVNLSKKTLMLNFKYNQLTDQHWSNKDDLGIVRIINEDETTGTDNI